MRKFFVKIALHVGKLCRQLCLKVLQPRRHLFQHLRITSTCSPTSYQAVVTSTGMDLQQTTGYTVVAEKAGK